MTKKRLFMLSGLSAAILVALPASAVQTISEQLKLLGGNDVSVTNNTGWLVNDSSGQQMGIDTNEIQARNNSAASTLYLQHGGGNLSLAAGGGHVFIADGGGDVSVAEGGGDLTIGSPITHFPFNATINDPGAAAYLRFTSNGIDFFRTVDMSSAIGGVLLPNVSVSGSTLCRNTATFQVGNCSSSRRFKTDIGDIGWGLREIMAMKPVSFSWKEGGARDVGFIAEDAIGVVPELVEYDDEGTVSGFNYRHYTAVLTRAIQEQQNTIADQGVELNTTQQAIALRDKEIARLGTEVTDQGRELAAQKSTNADQAAELKKLRDEVSALTKAVASMTARP